MDISLFTSKCDEAINDDLNTPIVLSHLFEAVKIINSTKEGTNHLSGDNIEELKKLFNKYVVDIFGLSSIEHKSNSSDIGDIMSLILDIRNNSKKNKDWETADKIRDGLNSLNIEIKDTKDGATWKHIS